MVDVLPTPRELEALKILWRKGPATVHEVHRELGSREGAPAYTTVLSLLQTMERKGMVGHEPSGKAYAYYARLRRDDVFRRLAAAFLADVFDGSLPDYLAAVLRGRKLTSADLEPLEAILAEVRSRTG